MAHYEPPHQDLRCLQIQLFSSLVCKGLNDIFSETTRPRALIFGMKHCLVDLYQIHSNGAPGVQNGPATGGLGFKNKIYLKFFFCGTARLRCLKYGMEHFASVPLPSLFK